MLDSDLVSSISNFILIIKENLFDSVFSLSILVLFSILVSVFAVLALPDKWTKIGSGPFGQ